MADTILKTSAGLITQVDAAGVIVDTAVSDPDTTTDAAHNAGDTAINVVAEGGTAAGDLIRIGSGDTMEIAEVASAAVGVITIALGLTYDQPSGVEVVEVEKLDLGHVAEGGVDFNVSEDVFEAGAATSAKTLIRKTTRITQAVTWPLLEWTANAFARAFGIPQSAILGDGTEGTPWRIALASEQIKSVTNASVYVECTQESGQIVEFQGWQLTPDLNKSWNVSRNSTAELPFGGDIKTIAEIRYTPT